MPSANPAREQWTSYLVLTLASAVTLCALGIAFLVTPHRARGLGVALLVLGLICAAGAWLLWANRPVQSGRSPTRPS